MEGINELIIQANQSGKTLEGPQLSLNTLPTAQTIREAVFLELGTSQAVICGYKTLGP